VCIVRNSDKEKRSAREATEAWRIHERRTLIFIKSRFVSLAQRETSMLKKY
jgi:hypothetical protein